MMVEPAVSESLITAIPRLRGFAISLCRNREQAEDLVQGALLLACANIGSFVPGTSMEAWLFTILRNHFYSECRRQRRFSRAIESLADTEARNPQQIAGVEYCEVRAALAKLDPKASQALMLVGASGLSYHEAASVCGCPVGTMKSRVSRARRELAGMLSISPPDYFEVDAVFSAAIASGDRVASRL
jgi:RNA polymerase sigma-70 factor (ECF subfamily)